MILSARQHCKRGGAAAVEATIVFPMLLMFFAATYELGRLGKIADAVSTAARNGAQYGSASTAAAADHARIRAAAVTETADLPRVTSTNPTVTPTSITNSSTPFIQVTVTYDMTGTSYFPFYACNTMTRTVQMPM